MTDTPLTALEAGLQWAQAERRSRITVSFSVFAGNGALQHLKLRRYCRGCMKHFLTVGGSKPSRAKVLHELVRHIEKEMIVVFAIEKGECDRKVSDYPGSRCYG